MKTIGILSLLLATTLVAHAQLAVTVSPPKITGSKAVVPLAMKNNFTEKIESARAVVFLSDKQGKVIGQTTRWVIGGSSTNGLAPGETNVFHFVINGPQPFTSTNLTAKLQFSRVILEGGKLADAKKDIQLQNSK